MVVGASAGGVTAVGSLLAGLPQSLNAAVFVVVHSHPTGPHLADVLRARSALPVEFGVHGQRIHRGCVYVAPPDNHLAVGPSHMEVVRGPRENGHRPSIDVLFRTAAKTHGARVIGVVLSGYQDCGTAGLLSIKARGGLAVVQDPRDARVGEMPRASIEHVKVDHVSSVAAMPELLERLVSTPAVETPAVDEGVLEIEGETKGIGTELVCPTCGGGLTEGDAGDFPVFRCHTGHAFSLDALGRLQEEEVERALWAAVRALEDTSTISRRLAGDATGELRERFADRSRVQARNAEVIRDLLVGAKHG